MNHRDKMRLAIEANVSLTTAVKWVRGEKVVGVVEDALKRAAAKLELEPPKANVSEPKRPSL